jgi:hypothetical protein
VQEERLPTVASELAARGELLHPATELSELERLGKRDCERVKLALAREGYLDGHAHSAAMLSRLARSPDREGAI